MIKAKYIFLLATLIITFAVIGFSVKRETVASKDMVKIETSVFSVKEGWGYNILVDKKIFIHQEFIPSISGYEAFRTKQDAEKTGEFQIQKIIHKKIPSVSVEELDSLQISH